MSENGPALITMTVYDTSDRVTSLTDAQGTTEFHHDAQGRLIETDTGPLVTMFVYDSLDRLMTETTRTYTTTYTYDALDRVISADTLGRTVHFYYDPGTRLLDEVDVSGSITTYTYASGRLSGATDPGTTSLIYTAAVPEPSSLVILGSAFLGFFGIRRRFAKARLAQRP